MAITESILLIVQEVDICGSFVALITFFVFLHLFYLISY